MAQPCLPFLPGKSGKSDRGLLASGIGESTTPHELLQAAAQRTATPKPDMYVEFLSSMAATEGETLGQRITQTVQASDNQLLLAASLGSPRWSSAGRG
ncbi:MAG: hypothetical protein E6K96_06690 [Thaumarchaeota archaeon]|nr:MAG: hypothetical protein E6K96_06690 [Nitrososphaerota archaeon]